MTQKSSKAQVVQFGSFTLDLTKGELGKDGKPVKLQPQPFSVLALLASHAGEVVSREEIQKELE